MPKRVNKSKKEIVSDIQLVQATERRRALIKEIVFPYLVSMNDSIGYSKIFLQAMSGVVEGIYEDTRKKTMIGDLYKPISEKIRSIFVISDPVQKKEYDRYMQFLDKLKQVSVQDFSYACELPRYIDGYMTKDTNKEPISKVSIDEILG